MVVITYRRPEQLRRAVAAVLEQVTAADVDGYVLVIDNDPQRSASDVVASFGTESVRYRPEPTPGIPAARNAALDAAHDDRLIVFIDDDELPQPGWLQALLDAWRDWGCDGIAGPNVRMLDGSEEPWVAASGFFDRRAREHGATIPGAPTSNLLLDMETVRRLGLRFDERFAMTGGSDTLFTGQLVARGGVIRWCENAVTVEPTPPERATREWVLARERRVGNTWSRVHLVLATGRAATLKTCLWLLAIAAKSFAVGAARWSVGTATGNLSARARGSCAVARARGLVLGVVGGSVDEYRRSDPG